MVQTSHIALFSNFISLFEEGCTIFIMNAGRRMNLGWHIHFVLMMIFFFKTKFFFFLLLFGYFLAKSPFFLPSLHFEKWDLSLDPISCHTKKGLPCLEIFNRTTLNWSIDFFEPYEKCTCPDTVGYNSKKSAIYFWVVPLKTIWLGKYVFYLQISKSNQSTLNSM